MLFRSYPELILQHFDAVMPVDTGPMVDVIGADYGPAQLLQQIGLLIGAATGVQEADGVGPILALDLAQALGNVAVSFIPANLLELAFPLDKWVPESILSAGYFVHVPAADTNPALVGGVRHTGIGSGYVVALGLEVDAAAHTTERAGG